MWLHLRPYFFFQHPQAALYVWSIPRQSLAKIKKTTDIYLLSNRCRHNRLHTWLVYSRNVHVWFMGDGCGSFETDINQLWSCARKSRHSSGNDNSCFVFAWLPSHCLCSLVDTAVRVGRFGIDGALSGNSGDRFDWSSGNMRSNRFSGSVQHLRCGESGVNPLVLCYLHPIPCPPFLAQQWNDSMPTRRWPFSYDIFCADEYHLANGERL